MDLNLYLGTGNSRSDLRMDLGSDLSLGPAPTDEGSPSRGAYVQANSVTMIPDSLANDEIFRGITPYSPSRGLPDEPYAMYNPLIHALPQSPGASFSPSFGAGLQEGDGVIARSENANLFYDSSFPGQSALGGAETHVSRYPSYESIAPLVESHEELSAAVQQQMPEQESTAFVRSDSLPTIRNLLRSPEVRIRNLIDLESTRRFEHAGQFPTSFRYLFEAPSLGAPSVSTPDRQVCNTILDRPMEDTGMDKVEDHEIGNESLEKGVEDKSRVINFDCNICLDMAKEPVVTSCGHLFCWPCLYQWLHLHSVHKECPVCKGEVETNITPIYGRGTSATEVEESSTISGDSGLKIPPRPRGRRFESLRQQIQRPVSRRLMEGFTDPWRRNIAGELQNLARMDDGTWRLSRALFGNNIPNERLDVIHHRLRARRQSHVRMAESLFRSNAGMMELPTLVSNSHAHNTDSVNQVSMNLFHDGVVSREGQSRIQNESSVNSFAVDGRNSTLSTSPTQPENHVIPVGGNAESAPPPVIQPPVTSQSADQASASSTLALIQDDTVANDALVEPNSAGSSRLFRRRRWTEASGSLDFDGGYPPARKRRRLN